MFDEPPPDTSYPEGSEDPLARTPPQDVAAEQNVLGAMLLSKDAIADVLEIIKAEDFYRPNHELIFNAILDLFGRGEPADAVMVAAELDRRGQLEKVGGRVYIADLVGLISVAANAEYYARIVRDKAVLRRLVDASVKISQLGYDGTGEVDDLVDEAQQTIYSITERNSAQDYVSIGELLQSTFDEIEAAKSNMTGVKTGFSDLDDLTNGLHAGQMVIVAARPSMGKSTLALDFARQAAIKNNLATAFFSLEMSKTEIVMRLLSAECTVKLNHIRNGGMTENDWDRLKSKVTDITTAPLFIDDSPNLTMMEIRAKARRLKQHHQLKLMIVDYMQLMTSGRRVESRQLEVSEFSRQIKLLAKELDIPIVALSQLNRSPEMRQDKKPMLADLRESGSLEQDADIVILLNRPDFYETDSKRAGEADLIVAKNRNGPTRTIVTVFQGHYSRFTNLSTG